MSTETESKAMTCLDAPSLDVAPAGPAVESLKRCRSGHPLRLYASGITRCPICVAATTKKWREEHSERWRESQRRWRARHRVEIAAYRKAWGRANREKVRGYQSRYRARLRAQA